MGPTDSQTPSPWTFAGESSPLVTNTSLVTMVEGRSFCITDNNGDISEVGPQGLFFLDTRLVNQYQILIDGDAIEPLGVDQQQSYSANFVGRHIGAVKVADAPTIAVRSRQIGQGMIETIEIRNHGGTRTVALVSAVVDCDFANLFAVKEGRAPRDVRIGRQERNGGLWFEPLDGRQIGLLVSSDRPADLIDRGRLDWKVELDPGESWTVRLEMAPWLGGQPVGPARDDSMFSPGARLEAWQNKIPDIESNHAALTVCTNKALSDLASLRIFDPTAPDTPVIAAGAPWFMTLFGRDSLISAWMALLVDPDLAVGVVKTLARFQGSKVDLSTDEQPGKIMHEMRFAGAGSAALDEGEIYYGTADATPLFVMLVAELERWGVDRSIIEDLMPHVDRAMAWIDEYGDADGDGYVEYERSHEAGLANQGWKDSGDGIRYGDGRVAEAPIALCEVQAYCYAAFRSRARLAQSFGDEGTADYWDGRAITLRDAFNRDFWIADRGWYAVGLDGDKNQIDSLTSNLGHCLWTGIIDEDRAQSVADHLLSDTMFSGWGIRTMADNTPGYNPTGYHVGSVWPHDTAIAAAGLMRYGFIDHSHRLMLGLLDAGAGTGGRLPELMAGFSRDEFATTMAYPASCSPQAWAAASPLLLLRWMLRLDPWFDRRRLWIDPILPKGVERIRVQGIPFGPYRLTVTVDHDEVEIEGLPDGMTLERGLRPGAPRDRWS